MIIEIHDADLAERLRRQTESTGATSAEEVLGRLLDTQQELDRWLLENRSPINAKIRRGIEQLDRGEGISADQAKERLQRKKTAWLQHRPATKP